MKLFLQRNKWPLIAGVIGAAGGFLYWKFVGCTSGSCPIKSVWYWSTLWGAAAGYLAGDMLKDFMIRRNNRKHAGEV